jgi:hypothetical protein
MSTLGSLNNREQGFQRPLSEQKRRAVAFKVAAFCLLFAAIIATGYILFFRQGAESPASPERRAQEAPTAISTEAQVFEDEAIIKDSKAVIGGTVRNISGEKLIDLSLEVELKRRADGAVETRTVAIAPDDLAPGQEGKFFLTLPRQEFSGTQIKRLKSAARASFIAFKSSPGAPRPKEPPTEPPTRTTVTVAPPSPRSKGEEFINTPDTPTRVP